MDLQVEKTVHETPLLFATWTKLTLYRASQVHRYTIDDVW